MSLHVLMLGLTLCTKVAPPKESPFWEGPVDDEVPGATAVSLSPPPVAPAAEPPSPERRPPSTSATSAPLPPRVHTDFTVADRFGPTSVISGVLSATTPGGGAAPESFSISARIGGRFALLARSEEPVSFTPVLSLLARVDDLGRSATMGLGLEGRFGLALTKPLRGFFPSAELYAFAATGSAGWAFAADSSWVRLGLGLQLNLYTLLTRSFGLGAFMGSFIGAVGAYFGALGGGNGRFLGGLGSGLGHSGGGGAGAILFVALAVVIVIVMLPPAFLISSMLACMAAMSTNLEVSWRPSRDGRTAPMTEFRLGFGF